MRVAAPWAAARQASVCHCRPWQRLRPALIPQTTVLSPRGRRTPSRMTRPAPTSARKPRWSDAGGGCGSVGVPPLYPTALASRRQRLVLHRPRAATAPAAQLHGSTSLEAVVRSHRRGCSPAGPGPGAYNTVTDWASVAARPSAAFVSRQHRTFLQADLARAERDAFPSPQASVLDWVPRSHASPPQCSCHGLGGPLLQAYAPIARWRPGVPTAHRPSNRPR
jgi:hypothetical protein